MDVFFFFIVNAGAIFPFTQT
ncbi:Protein of unknown function [Bacillus mobilis]|nr:Protein of unknown function [Bacillus mobilis]